MRRGIVALGMALVLLFLCAGCGENKTEKKDYPPYYETVKGLFGQNIETVITAMELKTEDFTYEHPLYSYNQPVQYLGHDFTMRLTVNGEGNCVNVMFTILVEDDPEKAANTTLDIRDKLMALYGESETNKYHDGRPQLETMTYDALYTELSNDENAGSKGLQWILGKETGPAKKDSSLIFTCAYPVAGNDSRATLIRLVYTLDTTA